MPVKISVLDIDVHKKYHIIRKVMPVYLSFFFNQVNIFLKQKINKMIFNST